MNMDSIPADVKAELDKIKPPVDQLFQSVSSAPLSQKGKTVLATILAAHAMGNACGHLKANTPGLEHVPVTEVMACFMQLLTETATQRAITEATAPTGPAG